EDAFEDLLDYASGGFGGVLSGSPLLLGDGEPEPESPFDEPSVDAEDVDPCADEPEGQPMPFQRWNRIYYRPRADSNQGLTMLLVSKFSSTLGEKRWVCIDPTGRLQVLDLGQPAKVKSTKFAGVNHGTFQGLSATEKQKAIEVADRIIATGSASTTGKITRDHHPRGGGAAGRRSHRRHAVSWLLKLGSNIAGYAWARRSLGTAAGSTFVLWRAVVYLNVVEWVKWSYSSLKETVDTVEYFREEIETVFEMHESGALEPLYFSVGVISPLACAIAHNFLWCLSSRASWLELALVVGHIVSQPVSDAEESDSVGGEVLRQLGLVAERLSALEERQASRPTEPPQPTPAPSAPQAPAKPGIGADSYDQMMGALLQRLDRHKEMVEQDSMAVTAGGSEQRVVSSTSNPEIDSLVKGLDDSFKDMREVAKEKLQAYSSDVAWTIPGGIKTRVAPSMVARLYRSGASAVASIREMIRTKQLDGNHMAEEALLISMMLDRSMVEAPADWINYKTTELAMRRHHGIERAFENVKQRSDWKPPNGSKAGWKSRVNYALLEELDTTKSDQDGLLIDGVEKELRERLAHRALLAKSLDKLQDKKHSTSKDD
ncbi:unnamed protein product, partial [Prorocentrum cordatum]